MPPYQGYGIATQHVHFTDPITVMQKCGSRQQLIPAPGALEEVASCMMEKKSKNVIHHEVSRSFRCAAYHKNEGDLSMRPCLSTLFAA